MIIFKYTILKSKALKAHDEEARVSECMGGECQIEGM